MGSDARRKSAGSLLMEELSLATLSDTAYVRLLSEYEMRGSEGENGNGNGHAKCARWGWLSSRRLGRDGRDAGVLASLKGRAPGAWPWLGRHSYDEFQFDPSKRWPQGW